MAGLGLALAATLLGGSQVSVDVQARDTYVGLDWFVLNLFFLALVFVPLERIFSERDQRIFRKGWRTDLAHFFVSHMGVQATVLLTMLPAAALFRWLQDGSLQRGVAGQPLWLQFIEALVLADLFAYASHRLFHAVPLLWRFHAIHHSCECLDWLASSRLHLVDILITRAVAFVPLYIMGFSPEALYPYLIFASLQGIAIHSNLRFDFGWLRYVLVTPRFHHWHHTSQPEGVDKNFAIHLPVIDWIFGTRYLPETAWPERYGIEGNPIPSSYIPQLLHPFRRHRPDNDHTPTDVPKERGHAERGAQAGDSNASVIEK
jgi:lathosterol oxidase